MNPKSNQNQNRNQLAADIQSFKSGFSEFWRSLFGERDDFNKVSYFRNPESLLDEVLFLLWILLTVASGFTIYYGFRYHLSIFENSQNNEWEALTVAVSIYVMGEILKVFLGHRFIRSVFSGMFLRGVPQLILVVFMGILSFYAFRWSVDISAKGYGTVTANKAKSVALSKTGDYSAITAPFDTQIAEAQKSLEAGRKTTWKGKVIWEGQQIIKEANKSLRQLNEQRAAAIAQAKAREDEFLRLTGDKIKLSEEQQNDYGGKAEYVVMFCLFMICLIEVIAYRQNKPIIEGEQRQDDVALKQRRSWFSLPSLQPTGKAENNDKTNLPNSRLIGFNRDEKGDFKKSDTTPTPSVSKPENEIELNPTPEKSYTKPVQQVAQHLTKEILGRWRSDAQTYYKRSMTQKTTEAKNSSLKTYLQLKRNLKKAGVEVEETATELIFNNYDEVRKNLPNAKSVEEMDK